MNFKLALFGLFIILIGAYTHSVEVNGFCDVSSTQCEITVNNIEVCNDTTQTETYNAYFNEGISSWFNAIPDKVTLAPGECEDISIFSVAGCYADPGDYFSELIIENGERFSLTCNFDLQQGHFVDIDVIPTSENATQCEEIEYDLVVTNNTIVPNQQIERIDLSISGLPEDWYILEEERILVEKGDSETVKLRVQAPCDADFGDYEFTARATLVNPNFYSEDSGVYVLGQGQSIQVLLGTEFEGDFAACLETPREGTIRIVNNGKLDDNLNISLQGPSFVSLNINQVSLGPGEEAELTVRFSETNEEPGNYPLTLLVESTLYDYSIQKAFDAILDDCFNLEVIKLEGQEFVCNEHTPTYRFALTNNKTGTIELDISIFGIDYELSDEKLTIEPGQTKEISAVLDVASLAKEAEVTRNDLVVELIIDTSGSMVQEINGKNKMETAKTSIINLVNNINEIDLGLRVFGQGELCEDSELLVEVDRLDISAITNQVSSMKPAGKTPLTQALEASIDDFPENKEKAIILVSDGKETCGGDISATARKLAGQDIRVYSVGFDIDQEGKEQLEEISRRTNGLYFDAKNPDELLTVLQKISQELDITPSSEGKRTLTLNLDSPYFSYQKDFSLTVSDCFNATMVAPELNLCPGIPKSDVVTIVNLGSKVQDFELNFSPDWIEAQSTVRVEANSEVVVPITAMPPEDTSEASYTINVSSGTVQLEQEKNINYLSSASCFGIDLIIIDPELNAATCQGVKQKIFVENRGVVAQTVKLTIDKPWVEVVQKEVLIEPGQRKEINFFVSPPFDLPERTFLNLIVRTDRGFETNGQVLIVVTGNQDSFGLGEVDIRVRDLNIMEVEGLDYDVELTFDIYNDSNRTLEVFNASILDFEGAVQLEKRFIAAKRTVSARMIVVIPDDLQERTVTVPIRLETDEGTYVRNITFEYGSGEGVQEEEADEPISIGTGFFTLANLSTGLLAALIVIVIGLIIFSAFRAVEKEGLKESIV
ncbi:VWA domain-containing protein, partial [archaeon]|nr:VWA domain-containing protein [archaeon]